MQLAWENLEVARKIYTDHQATHARELASRATENPCLLSKSPHPVQTFREVWLNLK